MFSRKRSECCEPRGFMAVPFLAPVLLGLKKDDMASRNELPEKVKGQNRYCWLHADSHAVSTDTELNIDGDRQLIV